MKKKNKTSTCTPPPSRVKEFKNKIKSRHTPSPLNNE
jgi:hypothetical protein